MDVIVINLPRRQDRKQRMRGWLPSSWHVQFLSDSQLAWDAQDADLWPANSFECFPWRIDSQNTWWNRPLKLGEVACALSHGEAWRLIVAGQSPFCLVLEDDVTGNSGIDDDVRRFMAEISNFDPTWDIAYLGRDALEPDTGAVSSLVCRPGYSYGTFGYVLSKNGAHKLLTYDYFRSIIPADEFLPATFVAHPREDVAERFPPTLRAYSMVDLPITHNDPKDSDTENSEFLRCNEVAMPPSPHSPN
jgi:glycosyl transferase family 25